jgi:hypothetical protein
LDLHVHRADQHAPAKNSCHDYSYKQDDHRRRHMRQVIEHLHNQHRRQAGIERAETDESADYEDGKERGARHQKRRALSRRPFGQRGKTPLIYSGIKMHSLQRAPHDHPQYKRDGGRQRQDRE